MRSILLDAKTLWQQVTKCGPRSTRRSVGAAHLALALSFGLAAFADPAAAAPRAERARKDGAKAELPSNHPLLIVVSTGEQNLKVYGANGRVIAQAPVSTGQSGHETPHGVFSIIAKEQMHYSNLYDDAPMPWMERITWSGVALHAGNLPGYPASHGCIRLPYNFSRSLYGLTRIGTRVIVSRGDPAPRSFAHPRLFAPLPPEAALVAATPSAASAAVSLLGITPALADDIHPTATRTREQAAAERAQRLATAKAQLEAAERSRSNLDLVARTAAEEAKKTQSALQDERAEATRLEQERRKVIAEIADVKGDIADLGKRAHRADQDAEIAALAEREQALEDRLHGLDARAESARRVVADQADLVAAAAQVDDAASSRRAATAADLKQANDEVERTRTALVKKEREEANLDRPITVFVSRKTGRLHVRQGFDDLFDTPVTIAQADHPVGTHVFTAVAETAGGAALQWHVTTVQHGQASEASSARRGARKKGDETVVDGATAARASTPERVLERIEVAPDVRERIAEFIKPGSTLIVSDHGPSHETGRGTDFVILTR